MPENTKEETQKINKETIRVNKSFNKGPKCPKCGRNPKLLYYKRIDPKDIKETPLALSGSVLCAACGAESPTVLFDFDIITTAMPEIANNIIAKFEKRLESDWRDLVDRLEDREEEEEEEQEEVEEEKKQKQQPVTMASDIQQDVCGAILHRMTHVHLKAYCGFCEHRHSAGGCSIISEQRRFTDQACIKFSEKE